MSIICPRCSPCLSRETLEYAVQSFKYSGKDLRKDGPHYVFLDHFPSYNDFLRNVLLSNQLCVLTSEATVNWRSRKEWVSKDGSPNFEFLCKAFGDATVPVANCKKREFSAQMKTQMKMSDFLEYWQKLKLSGYPSDADFLYLKDWHFVRAFPDYQAYKTCGFFCSDWLNEFWDTRNDTIDDYKFVYMGPKGTWTPFHADVFHSFSWSANICGQKKWIFFPPGEEKFLKDIHGNLAYNVNSVELNNQDLFPHAHLAKNRIEIIQNPGEIVFVPSCWHHQVENIEDTISINHNWMNGCNAHLCWMHMKSSLLEVQNEISDCCDMEGWKQQCQIILRACTGMDFSEFFRFMQSIAQRRLRALNNHKSIKHICSNNICRCEQNASDNLVYDLYESDNVLLAVENDSDSVLVDTKGISEHLLAGKDGTPENLVVKDEASENHFGTYRTSENLVVDGKDGTSENLISKCGNSESLIDNEKTSENFVIVGKDETLETVVNDKDRTSENNVTDKDFGTSETSVVRVQEECQAIRANTPKDSPTTVYFVQGQACTCLLNISEPIETERISRYTYWGRCDVNHALFDLASVALVVKDMIKSTDLVDILPVDQLLEPANLLQEVFLVLCQHGVEGLELV